MRLDRMLLAVVFAASAPHVVAQTSPAPLPPTAYAADPEIETPALSPDGRWLTYVAAGPSGQRLMVREVDGEAATSVGSLGDREVQFLSWADNDRVLVVTRTVAGGDGTVLPRQGLSQGTLIDVRGRSSTPLLPSSRTTAPIISSLPYRSGGAGGPVLVFRGYQPSLGRWPLFAVPTVGGEAEVLEHGDFGTSAVITDAAATLVARSRFLPRTNRWLLERRLGREWREVSSRTGPIPPTLQGLGGRADTVTVLIGAEADAGLYEVDLSSGAWTRLQVEAAPARSALFHPATRLRIGVVAGDVTNTFRFDDVLLQRRWSAITRAFPDARLAVMSFSDRLDRVLLAATRSGATGAEFYLVDMAGGQAEQLAVPRPALADRIAPQTVVRYRAGDGLELYGVLTRPLGSEGRRLPLLISVHGDPWSSWSTPGYDHRAQAAAAQGYAVFEPNYRGSAQPLAIARAGDGEMGRLMQTDLSDAVTHLAAEGVIDPERVCIMGQGYGGYAALAGVTLQQDIYRCAVALEPWVDLPTLTRDLGLESSTGPMTRPIRIQRLLGFDGPSRVPASRSPLANAGQGAAPVLIIRSTQNQLGDQSGPGRMVGALRQSGRTAEQLEIRGAISLDGRTEDRVLVLDTVIDFLRRHNPPDEFAGPSRRP